MNTFCIFVDGQLFYHPQLSKLAIIEAKMTEDAENIDSPTLSVPFNHPYSDSIRPMVSTIVCKKGDATVFKGRTLDDGSDFYNTHTWTCESAPAYLKDSQQPLFSCERALKGLLEYFFSVHNEAVKEGKRFKPRNIAATDNNDYINYSNSEYPCTLDAIKSKLISTHDGHLIVRYAEPEKILDYLAGFNTHSVRSVEYGKSLTNVKITRDYTGRIIALIPFEARKKTTDEEGNEVESDERADITSINDGLNYTYDDVTVKKIGWTWVTEVWDDVTFPGNSPRKAKTRLAELIVGITSMELTIVDESDAGTDIGSIHARQSVNRLPPPHGIDGRYVCMSETIDYLNPSGSTITIGASGIKLTGISAKQNANITELTDDLTGKTAEIQSAVAKVDAAEATVKDVKKATDAIIDDITALQESTRECHSEISKTSEEINLTVREEYISRSEMATVQQDFQSTIMQNNSKIRMDFSAVIDELKDNIATNQELPGEYIRFKGVFIESGKVGNAFTVKLSNNELALKENGQKIAHISNNNLVITNAEIHNRLPLGDETRGWFDFILRNNGNLFIKWRDPASQRSDSSWLPAEVL